MSLTGRALRLHNRFHEELKLDSPMVKWVYDFVIEHYQHNAPFPRYVEAPEYVHRDEYIAMTDILFEFGLELEMVRDKKTEYYYECSHCDAGRFGATKDELMDCISHTGDVGDISKEHDKDYVTFAIKYLHDYDFELYLAHCVNQEPEKLPKQPPINKQDAMYECACGASIKNSQANITQHLKTLKHTKELARKQQLAQQ